MRLRIPILPLCAALAAPAACAREKPPGFAETLASAYASLAEGEPGEAEKRFEAALRSPDAAKAALPPRTVAAGLAEAGRAYEIAGRGAEAERVLKRALELGEQALGTDPAQTAFALDALAEVYESGGRFAEAIETRERESAALTRAYGQNHPAVGRAMERIVALYRGKGEPEKAELTLRKLLDVREKALGGEHPLVVRTLLELAAVLRDVDDPEEATAVSARVQRILDKQASERAKAEAAKFDR